MRHGAADLGRRFVFAQTFIDDLAQQIVVGPGQVFDFGDEFRAHPMHAAQNERRAEPAGARRRHVERHIGRRQGLEAAPQAFKLRPVEAGADAAGINQPVIRVVISEQQSAEAWRFSGARVATPASIIFSLP